MTTTATTTTHSATPGTTTPVTTTRTTGITGELWRVRTVLTQAQALLADAHAQREVADRFRIAHLAALRAAAALLLVKTAPGTRLARRPTSAWTLIDRFAPEFGLWAGYFAAHAGQRAAADAGAVGVVTRSDAVEMLGAVRTFVALVQVAVDEAGRARAGGDQPDGATRPTLPLSCASSLPAPPRHLVLSEAG